MYRIQMEHEAVVQAGFHRIHTDKGSSRKRFGGNDAEYACRIRVASMFLSDGTIIERVAFLHHVSNVRELACTGQYLPIGRRGSGIGGHFPYITEHLRIGYAQYAHGVYADIRFALDFTDIGVIVHRNLFGTAEERTSVGINHTTDMARGIYPAGPCVSIGARIGGAIHVRTCFGLAPLPLVRIDAIAALGNLVAAEMHVGDFRTKRLGSLVGDVVLKVFVHGHFVIAGISRETNTVGHAHPVISGLPRRVAALSDTDTVDTVPQSAPDRAVVREFPTYPVAPVIFQVERIGRIGTHRGVGRENMTGNGRHVHIQADDGRKRIGLGGRPAGKIDHGHDISARIRGPEHQVGLRSKDTAPGGVVDQFLPNDVIVARTAFRLDAQPHAVVQADYLGKLGKIEVVRPVHADAERSAHHGNLHLVRSMATYRVGDGKRNHRTAVKTVGTDREAIVIRTDTRTGPQINIGQQATGNIGVLADDGLFAIRHAVDIGTRIHGRRFVNLDPDRVGGNTGRGADFLGRGRHHIGIDALLEAVYA